jgi:hypothetical protein
MTGEEAMEEIQGRGDSDLDWKGNEYDGQR